LSKVHKGFFTCPFEVFNDIEGRIDSPENEASVLNVEILLIDQDRLLIRDQNEESLVLPLI
jgi:hypothetical protein